MHIYLCYKVCKKTSFPRPGKRLMDKYLRPPFFKYNISFLIPSRVDLKMTENETSFKKLLNSNIKRIKQQKQNKIKRPKNPTVLYYQM